MKIYTIGDSHSYHGFQNIYDLRYNLGPLLCYTFGKEKFNRFNITNYKEIKEEDVVIFCLGEIDCRCHIYKHISEENTYTKIIDNIVNNYLETIKLNENLLSFKIKICIYAIVPSVKKDSIKNKDISENKEFPFLGTDEDRKTYVKYFNNKLKEKCKEYNYLFIDVYDKYTDEEGYLNNQYSDGLVHIDNGIYIKEFLEENNIVKE
jgi:hypothetical protein